MSRPEFVFEKLRRTDGGALATSLIQRVRSKLVGGGSGGFVLLPSDTCYSLAALPLNEAIRTAVNAILAREDCPISLAFSSYFAVQQLVEVDNTTALLLEAFTPGPITLVCNAKANISPDFLNAIGSPDRTIGVRIPDSRIERDVAACTQFPLMSVAVRDPETGEAVQNFRRACQLVSSGIERYREVGWGALEGDVFCASHSTVVRMGGPEGVSLLRGGDISFEEILRVANSKNPSGLSIEDWG